MCVCVCIYIYVRHFFFSFSNSRVTQKESGPNMWTILRALETSQKQRIMKPAVSPVPKWTTTTMRRWTTTTTAAKWTRTRLLKQLSLLLQLLDFAETQRQRLGLIIRLKRNHHHCGNNLVIVIIRQEAYVPKCFVFFAVVLF